MRRFVLTLSFLLGFVLANAVNVTVNANNEEAAAVFRRLMEQTGMNFVYSSDLLKDVMVTVNMKDKPLKRVLAEMFHGSDIEYKVRKNDVILKRKKSVRQNNRPGRPCNTALVRPDTTLPLMLEEVVVVSRLEAPVTQTAEIGAGKLSAADVANTPALFGEPDVIKSMTMLPGITEGTEGMAGMNVHGGGADENMYMLDNVPLYQANHFGGLFSAFNTNIIRYADFFKSSIPAKYDGRLSSFMDVRTRIGSSEGHHGSLRLGLTSGAFDIDGPIGRRMTYSVALRRTWFDLLTIPYVAIYNSDNNYDKIRFQYAFMDLNAKLNYHVSDRASCFVSAYFGHDVLKSGEKDDNEGENSWKSDDKYDMYWGNLVLQAVLDYRLTSAMTFELTSAHTRYFMTMKGTESYVENIGNGSHSTKNVQNSNNNINDWIFRGDFNLSAGEIQLVRFGASYIRHSFLPQHNTKEYVSDGAAMITVDSTLTLGANEANMYVEDDWRISDRIRANCGFHGTVFNIGRTTRLGYAPRLSISYAPCKTWAIKAAYGRTNQFVHQLSHTYLSLPTDQWIPIAGKFKPESADKFSVGGYWESADRQYAVSVEGYYKKMRNLVEYREDYYLSSPTDMWTAQLCSGSGTAKGIDIKLEKSFGKISGHMAYSLGWADRTFADKNRGKTYPARFDHRHSVKILANWEINKKVMLNAAWTGHSGNRFTLLPQDFLAPDFDSDIHRGGVPKEATVNNYQLPFYHRLDLSMTVRNSRGYWTFGLYNAYCHRNTIGIRRGEKRVVHAADGLYSVDYVPTFQKINILPIIPSISYTWQF